MPFKITTLHQQATGPAAGGTSTVEHIAGWSESFYSLLTSPGAIIANLEAATGYLWARSRLMCFAGQILGYRLAQVDPRTGRAQTRSTIWPGVAMYQPDLPQASVLVSVPSATSGNIRRFAIRGVPDSQIVDGEYQPDTNYQGLVNNFFAELSNWAFRGQDLTLPRYNILSINGSGVMTLTADPSWATGYQVQISNTFSDLTGEKISAKKVIATASGATITLQGWPSGLSCTGGTVRRILYNTYAMDGGNAQVARATVRKVGRPFGEYRGRRSKRRTV
jgi:hypothetical protein